MTRHVEEAHHQREHERGLRLVGVVCVIHHARGARVQTGAARA